MKKIMCTAVIALLLWAAAAYCHAPLKVELTFDQDTRILTVDHIHKVRDAQLHYIYEAKVYLNDELIVEQEMKAQDNTDGGSLVYKLTGVKAGDTIKVSLNCNKGGRKAGSIEILKLGDE